MKMSLLALFSLTALSGTAFAQIIYDTNLALAPGATPLMGYANDSLTGSVSHVQGGGTASNINDGNTTNDNYNTTHVPHWDSANPDSQWTYDYAGVAWATAQDGVATVRLYLRRFNDGGYFATPEYNDPDPDADSLSFAPQIQFSLDGGTTWAATTNQSDDYDASYYDGTEGTPPVLNTPWTFTFDPVDGINAIRIIGDGWGTSGSDSTGFIAVREFEVFAVPEPTGFALSGLGLAILALVRRRPVGVARG